MGSTETYKKKLLSENGQNSMKLLEKSGNKLVLSSLTDFYDSVDATGFSIKYVANGTEAYTLDDEQYMVGSNSYLLTNRYKTGKVTVQSTQPVQGICITIDPSILVNAVASLQRPDTACPDEELGQFFNSALFPDDQYNAGTTELGAILQRLSTQFSADDSIQNRMNKEFFFELAASIVKDQTPVFKQLKSIPVIKNTTKKELYKKIKRGCDFMEEMYHQSIDIESIAQAACMSEFHFFRLFKKTMGVTPHQYLLQKKLERATSLLKAGSSVQETAFASGFADIYSFSKSFKKKYGIAPSALHKK